jgi:hypothetical protein
MNKTRFWLAAIAVLTLVSGTELYAQNPQPALQNSPERVVRVIEVKYVNPYELSVLLEPFSRSSGLVKANSQLNTITLSGSSEVVSAMEEIVRRFDVAPPKPKNIEITAYLLAASDSASPVQAMPTQLEPVLRQLRSTFAYKSYQLLETIIARSGIDFPSQSKTRFSSSGSIPNPVAPDKRIPYSFEYIHPSLSHDEKGDSIHLESLRLYLEFEKKQVMTNEGSKIFIDSKGFSTNLDLRAGQMVVVGKTNFDVGNDALIAVISAKVVD